MSTSIDQIRKQRLEFIRNLQLKATYHRTHTSTGVFRRNPDGEGSGKPRLISQKSLANLSKRGRIR